MTRRTFEYPPAPRPEDLLAVYPDFAPEFVDVYGAAVAYTMTSPERMHASGRRHSTSRSAVCPGAFVECGVWRGGSTMVVAHALKQVGDVGRELWLYDTFSGMPPPSAADIDFTGRAAADHLANTVDAHFATRNDRPLLARIDYTGRIAVRLR